MKVAIVGYGVEGQSAYRYWSKQHADITICDQDEHVEVPAGVAAQLGETYLDNLGRFDVIMRTAGLRQRLILDKYPGIENKITSVIDEFLRVCPAQVIGVTGTKGKNTTAVLIQRILQAAGKRVHLNASSTFTPLDFMSDVQKSDYVVLELTSFQLEAVHRSPHLAVCLMVVPEHLNWHDDFEAYKAATGNIFRFQDMDDIAVYNVLSPAARELATLSPATTVLPFGVPGNGKQIVRKDVAAYVQHNEILCRGKTVCRTGEVGLVGRHNLQNICAAIAATWDLVDGNVAIVRQVVTSFNGLEHRLQFVRALGGVRYFDDSSSTTPETAIAAINAFDEPKILILGGSSKGVPFDALAEAVASGNVKQVLAIGATGEHLASLLRQRGYEEVSTTDLADMPTIVAAARKLAAVGDVVILSPGAASYDMFKNYYQRGEEFKTAVRALKGHR